MYRRPPSSLVIPRAQRPPLTVGIRREDPNRIWERRTPLTPDAVHYLVSQKNVNVHIEHCDRRVFPDAEYTKAGAKVKSKLDDAHIFVGIKETPIKEIITAPVPTPATSQSNESWSARTHVMFSHTAKGQPYNTGLLSHFVAPTNMKSEVDSTMPRLIDYELLTNDADGKRTVGFGWFAGVAGVLESLSSMAHSHLEIGIASPFLYTPRPHTHPSLESLRTALRGIGDRISQEGTPASLGPFVIGLTGTGNVSKGCLSILSELPIVKVSVKDLHALVTNKETDLHKIYLVHALPGDYLYRQDGQKYDREHYYEHPQSYRSTFAEDVAPYLTLLLNGAGWSPSFPRLMTNEQLVVALDRARPLGGARFTNIGDISCDVGGGLEFLTQSTTLSSPFYTVRPPTLPGSLPSIEMMSVDILPASLPLDASTHFSKVFLPYLESLIENYTSGHCDEYAGALDRATIASNGQLVGKHIWLQSSVDKFYASAALQSTTGAQSAPINTEITPEAGKRATQPGVVKKKKMLMLGSGMVAGPAVDEIAKRPDIQLLIASNSLVEAEKLAEEHHNVQYRIIDMADRDVVSTLISEADVVISLLPATFHTAAAEMCIQHRKHLVTASYISPAMDALHKKASEANVLLLNEIGLDPGIDHCSAISLVSKLHAERKQVVAFTSFCGGLPAPDVPHGPLRYKFSWSPRGVLTAALNAARYRLNHKVIEISGENLLKNSFPDVPITNDFALEGIANRDSIPYSTVYELGYVRTIMRGTLRYPGFSALMQSFKDLGLLESTKTISLDSWSTLVQQSMMLKVQDTLDPKNTLSAIGTLVQADQVEPLHDALEWLSLLPNTTNHGAAQMPPLPTQPMAPLDLFAYLLAQKLQYKPHERDMVILSHEIIARSHGLQQPEEIHTSSLITYGTPKASAMARTVGLPVAFAALNVLDGKVKLRGVIGPGDPSVYKPVLEGLEKVGLGMKESKRMGSYIDTVEHKIMGTPGN
ncbi:Saccharopine dehydrogenase-domain-containing protein [Collybia nuda]|uniref:Saccharopine dehydrogenase-domain-containing protein n=1 Tax=Collybia nuda TaxID=64659 RepID=A0A9P5YB56_9AGAR|nr:Saccharopine dehydrogenase-domain-containing protein [Collybia nuda]